MLRRELPQRPGDVGMPLTPHDGCLRGFGMPIPGGRMPDESLPTFDDCPTARSADGQVRADAEEPGPGIVRPAALRPFVDEAHERLVDEVLGDRRIARERGRVAEILCMGAVVDRDDVVHLPGDSDECLRHHQVIDAGARRSITCDDAFPLGLSR